MSRRSSHEVRPSGQAGFTLLEVLASITIASVLIAGMAAGTRMLTARWSEHIRQLDAQDRWTTTAQLLRRDLGGLLRVLDRSDGTPAYAFVGRPTLLRFVALEPDSPGKPGPYVLTYRSRASRGGAALVRSRTGYRPARSIAGAQNGEGVNLLDGRRAYTFSYGEFTATSTVWRTTWSGRTRLPDLVRLQVRDPVSGRLLAMPLIAPIRATAAPGCTTSRAKHCLLQIAARQRGARQ